jgi:hypothetical protein
MNQGTKSRKKGVKKQRCSQAKVSKNRNFLEEVSPNSPQKQFASTTYYEQNYEPTRRGMMYPLLFDYKILICIS